MQDRSAAERSHQPTTRTEPIGGRIVAWLGFIFGSLVSVDGNWLASRIPPPGAPVDWTPSGWAQVWAAAWPIALLLAVEALARIQWPSGVGWVIARYGGVGAVALFSAVISYGHIRSILVSWGYSPLGAAVGPLAIDGLMVVTGFALLAHERAARSSTPPSPTAEPGSQESISPRPDDADSARSEGTERWAEEPTAARPDAPVEARPVVAAKPRPQRRTTTARSGPVKPTGQPDRTDDELMSQLRAMPVAEGADLPSRTAVQNALGVGSGRASRLLERLAGEERRPVTAGSATGPTEGGER
ncbi:hypothetical protein [Amycolatopsis sp. GM8]|uniref:hypothetical protein n=1 Tax=Amycolatopsis sp. GM8 TaxID=2896530 RepID=UPI001F42A8AE|nr:hypothetical protein [Amycolatopsis sp. GM8]